MNRDPNLETPRVSVRMRKSMLQIQDKHLWIRRHEPQRSPSSEVRPERKRKNRSVPPGARRPLSIIVMDYKKTLAKLDDIEAEIAQWLCVPPATTPPRRQQRTTPAVFAIPPDLELLTEGKTAEASLHLRHLAYNGQISSLIHRFQWW
jgi:hypothetical protein